MAVFVRKSDCLQKLLQKSRTRLNFNKLCYSSSPENHYDIIIAGGGMVGTTLACTLGQNSKLSDKSILLLEGSKKSEFKLNEQYSNRVSALNPSTYNLLNKLGAWKHISDMRYAPVKKLQVWDGISDAMITFNHHELLNVVAYIVENDVLIEAVGRELQKSQNVKVLNEAKIKGYVLPKVDTPVTINMEDGSSFTCNLLLGSDGANSRVRQAMGVQFLSWNYNQKGIVATVKLSEPSDNIVAWQRFLPTGPIALLPLTDQLSSLVWSTNPEHAEQLLKLSEEQFVDALNEALWKAYTRNNIVDEATKRFNNFLEFLQAPPNTVRQLPPSICAIQSGSRAAFPLGFGHATNYVDKKVALVGDAAHRVHPLAGQGVNLGFGDVAALNEILGESVYNGSDLGNLYYLRQYEAQRQWHNVPTMFAIDGLHKLYTTECTPIVILRSLGLQFTHALTPLKKAIISHAAQ